MRVLITGTGNVGRHVGREAIQRGAAVSFFDLRAPDAKDMDQAGLGSCQVYQGDVTDLDQLRNALETFEADTVVHTAAALTPMSRSAPAKGLAVNIMGSVNVMEAVRLLKLKRAVLAGSEAVQYSTFPRNNDSPMDEDFTLKVVSERPSSFYAAAKLSIEFIAHCYGKDFGTDLVVLRFGNIIGEKVEGQAGAVVDLLDAYLTPAVQGRPATIEKPSHAWYGEEEFVDARDVATGVLSALTSTRLQQRVYHLTSAQAYSTDEFVQAIQRTYPDFTATITTEARVGTAGASRTARSDIASAARDFDYRPRFTLAESLMRYGAGIAA